MEPKQKSNGKRRKLIDADDPLMSLKRVLDQLLMQGELLPEEIKRSLVAARDIAWEQVRTAEENVNAKTR